jgi:hypothetical protein
VDFAPAMVGFEIRDGRSIPKFDGVVVCLDAAPLLIEAAGGAPPILATLSDLSTDPAEHATDWAPPAKSAPQRQIRLHGWM